MARYSFPNLPKRHFEFHSPQDGPVYHLEPPTLRVVRDLNSEQDFDGVIQTVSEILSRNKEGAAFSPDEVLDLFTYDQLRDFIVAFRRWLIDTRENDPN